MNKRLSRMSSRYSRADVGTLWTMRRRDSSARCALLSWPAGLELCVLIDGRPLLSKRCHRAEDAFSLAAQWRQRMLEKGWSQVVPGAALSSTADDRYSA